jgi:hypothetical protein
MDHGKYTALQEYIAAGCGPCNCDLDDFISIFSTSQYLRRTQTLLYNFFCGIFPHNRCTSQAVQLQSTIEGCTVVLSDICDLLFGHWTYSVICVFCIENCPVCSVFGKVIFYCVSVILKCLRWSVFQKFP